MNPKQRDFRRRRNYYLALASDAGAPALRAAARLRCGAPTARDRWRKGLIISHTHIGDVLYRTPSLPYLAEATPQCEWHYLTSPESSAVLAGNKAIASTMPFVRGENSWNLTEGAFGRLGAERYDVALCTNSLRAYPDITLATALGIPNRVGYGDRGFSGLLTIPVTVTRPQPFAAYFREMVRQICNLDATWPMAPQISITKADNDAANDFLSRIAGDITPIVACCPTTRQPEGSWAVEHFASAINACGKRAQFRVVVCGTARDSIVLNELAAALTVPATVLAGELSLQRFAALLSKCQAALTQDSAARHLANAVGTPVVFFRNLAVDPTESGVYSPTEQDAAPPERCDREEHVHAAQATGAANAAEKMQRILGVDV